MRMRPCRSFACSPMPKTGNHGAGYAACCDGLRVLTPAAQAPDRLCRMSRIRFVVSGVVAALLAACGGGGDSGGSSSSTPPPSGNTGGGTVLSSAATCGLPDFESAVMARVNQWRASGANCGSEGSFGPAPALAWNDLLTQAALGHSQDMVAHNFFDHTGSDGSTLGTRVTAVGYGWASLGENIAAGQTSVNQVVDGWIASPGHCANLMNPNFVHVGVACVQGNANTTYPTYWTMDLGQPR